MTHCFTTVLVLASFFTGLASADLQPKSAHRIGRHSRLRRALPSGWEARGCFTDAPAPNRVLQYSHTDDKLTPTSCVQACSASGYSFAGTQYGNECWCGKSLKTSGSTGVLASSGCDMPCRGDAKQICGGGYRMNLFSKAAKSKETATPTPSSPASGSQPGGKSYTLSQKFSGKNFFDNWWFFNLPDPTNGQVQYLNKEDAFANKLAYVQDDGVAVMKVDNTTRLGPGEKRKSVRIQSTKQYNRGLIVADILQMPFGCSVWPAYWTVGDNWPNNGEVDLLENVNLSKTNQYTLHTGPNSKCMIDDAPTAKYKTSTSPMGKMCASKEGANAGCGFSDSSPSSYGQGFNDAGGAVIAMDWQPSAIRVWSFARNAIPSDLQNSNAKPNPDGWGAPVAAWTSSSCDLSSEVKNHNMVFNTAICGSWAGDAYGQSGCPGTCSDRVMDPANFDNAVWKIKSVAIYQ